MRATATLNYSAHSVLQCETNILQPRPGSSVVRASDVNLEGPGFKPQSGQFIMCTHKLLPYYEVLFKSLY